MSNTVISFPLTSRTPRCGLCNAGSEQARAYAVELLDLARFIYGEPPGCTFLRYDWSRGKLYALYKHGDWDAVAAFAYDARTRKLTYIAALHY